MFTNCLAISYMPVEILSAVDALDVVVEAASAAGVPAAGVVVAAPVVVAAGVAAVVVVAAGVAATTGAGADRATDLVASTTDPTWVAT